MTVIVTAVIAASSADEAQKVFAQRSIDVILSDQRMPRRTGIELLEWVRHHSPQTVRILASCVDLKAGACLLCESAWPVVIGGQLEVFAT